MLNTRMTLMGGISLELVALTWFAVHQLFEASAWPSIDDEPPLEVPAIQAPTESWEALEQVIVAMPMQHESAFKAALETEGMPSERGVWREASEELETLSSVMKSPSIVSPTRPLTDYTNQPSLIPLIPLAKAQLLRAWDKHHGGDTVGAVDDMLLVDRFGQKLTNGSQSLFTSVLGLAIQGEAIRELQELLALVYDPSIHALVAKRLPTQAVESGRVRAALLIECQDNEALLKDPMQASVALSERSQPKRLPGTSKRLPGIFYDADATVAQHRRMCRRGDRWAARVPAERQQRPEPPPSPLPEGLSKVLTYNAIGIELLKVMSIEGSVNQVDMVYVVQLKRDVLRLLTAARQYGFARSGTLPERAEELVPAYLPSVPIDPFNGEALEIGSGRIETSQDDWVEVTLPSAKASPVEGE